ncbi:MAG: efflux RND transporter periplasmic adaptor subunit [Rickettsiaceae bacterium]
MNLAQRLCIFVFFASLSLNSSALAGNNNHTISVRAFTLDISEFYDIYNSTAKVRGSQSRDIYSQVTGKITSISENQGEMINAGSMIIAIDQDVANSLLEKAKANYSYTQFFYNKELVLSKKNIISNEVLKKSYSTMQDSFNQLQNAINTYNKMIITAPFDGKIGVTKFQIGDNIKIGDYIISIISLHDYIMFADLPPNLLGKVNKDTTIYVIPANGEKIQASVDSVSEYLSNNGSITAKIIIHDKHHQLIFGDYAKLKLIINPHRALGVPQRATLRNDKGTFVYKIDENNLVKQVYITVGSRTDNMIEVVSGDLDSGDKIVLEGLTKIRENSIVKIIE